MPLKDHPRKATETRKSALTGCNSDRGVGLMDEPAPRIVEGPEIACDGLGWCSRKAVSTAFPEQDDCQVGETWRVS
jgi:hypothetical protein